MSFVEDLVKKHEGCRLAVYKDSMGYRTIGYGRCLDTKGISQSEQQILKIDFANIDKTGITQDQADNLLRNDIAENIKYLQCYPFFNSLDERRQAVMVDLRFNLGGGGLAKFVNFLGFMRVAKYEEAASELMNSAWAKQVGVRANEDSEIIRTG